MSQARRPVRSLPGLASGLAVRWWPQLVALAAACAVVATTITGALGVGDVIQTGLRRLAVGRLGDQFDIGIRDQAGDAPTDYFMVIDDENFESHDVRSATAKPSVRARDSSP